MCDYLVHMEERRALYNIADSGFTAPLISISAPDAMLTAPADELSAAV